MLQTIYEEHEVAVIEGAIEESTELLKYLLTIFTLQEVLRWEK